MAAYGGLQRRLQDLEATDINNQEIIDRWLEVNIHLQGGVH